MGVLAGLHRWLGLGLALFLAAQALSGSVLLFRQTANLWLHGPALVASAGPARPLQEMVTPILADRPGAILRRIDYPARADGVYMLRLDWQGQDWRLALDPGSGRVTREAAITGWPVEWLLELHYTLLTPWGEPVVGLFGLGLLILSLAGTMLWWARRPRGGGTFDLQRGGSPVRRQRGLHRLVGFLCAVPLLALSATGALMTLVPLVTSKPVVTVAERPGHPLLPLDRVIDAARADRPGAPVRNVRLPGAGGRLVLVYLEDAAPGRPGATWRVWLDRYDARILARRTDGSLSAGSRFMEWLLPVHTGMAGGLALRLTWMAAALGLLTLIITGLRGWWERWRAEPYRMRVTGVERLSRDVVALSLRRPFALPLPLPVAPGAHIDLHLPHGLVRQYSLTNAPDDRRHLRIAVQLEPGGRGGSRAVHKLRPGDRVGVGGPRHAFALDLSVPHHILLAAGIGITPIIAMADHLAALGRPFQLHYAAREGALLLFRERLARFGAATNLYPGDAVPRRRLDIAAILAAAPAGSHVQACGPARFLNDLAQAAARLGWDDNRVRVEGFTATGTGPDAQPFSVRLPDGRLVPVAADQTMAQALIAAGVAVPLSCGQGLCGTCALPLLSGQALHRDHCLSAAERATRITPCCSRGTGELGLG